MESSFGKRLLDYVKERGMSQKDLARIAGVTESAMSHYIRGDRIPRASVLARIAEALGTTSDYLMNGSPANFNEEIVQARRLIARNVKNMTHEEKMEIVSILLGKD